MRALCVLAFIIILSLSSGRSTRKTKTFCLEEAIKRLVRKDEDLIVVRDGRDKECFPILKLKNPKVVVDFKRAIKGSINITATFVICVNSNGGLNNSLKYLKMSSLWKNGTSAHAKYLIVSSESKIKQMGQLLFGFGITKAKLIQRKVNSKTSKIVKGKYNFFKHSRRSCKYTVIENVVEISKIETIIMALMSKKIATSKYQTYNSRIVSEGIKVMAETLSVKTKIQYSWEYCFHNSKQNELCLLQLNKWSASTAATYRLFQIIIPCVQDRHIWLVPRIQKTNHHQTMLFVFEWQTSILLLIVFTLMVLKSWLASRRLGEHNELQRVSTWMLIVAQLMVAVPTSLFPNRTSLRVLFIFYIFYCFQISNWFQGYMTSVLVDPPNEPEFETEFELYKSAIPLYVNVFEGDMLETQLRKTYDEIKDRLIIDSTRHSYRDKIEFCAERGCALLITENSFLIDFLQFNSKFYLLKYGDFGAKSELYLVRHGHHLSKKVSNFQQVIKECGICQKIARDVKKEIVPSTNANPESNIYLRLVHLQEVFVLFALGMSIATIALLAELIYYYRFDTRRVIVV